MNRSLVLRWGPWNIFYSCHRVPGSAKTEEDCAGRNPAAPVTGGEGPGVEELEEVRAHRWVVLGHGEVLEGGGSTEQGGRRRSAPAQRRSGGHGWRWLGLGAPLGRGEAVPEVG